MSWTAAFASLWLLVAFNTAQAIDFDRYHSLNEIDQYLKETAETHPDIVHYVRLGTSEQGRVIAYVVISKSDPAQVPALYFNGTHHGDEKSSTEGILALIDHLLKNREDPQVAHLLTRYAVYLQPLVNPDGHAAHTRGDAQGRDPNRDYAYPLRSESGSFKIAGIRLVKELVDRIRPRASAAYHSGMEGVLWPWAHSSERTADQDLLYTLSKNAATAMGFTTYVQSYYDYETHGEYIDYVYWKHHTLGVTFEVSQVATPEAAQLSRVVANSVMGAMQLMHDVAAHDTRALLVERAPNQANWRQFLVLNDLLQRRSLE